MTNTNRIHTFMRRPNRNLSIFFILLALSIAITLILLVHIYTSRLTPEVLLCILINDVKVKIVRDLFIHHLHHTHKLLLRPDKIVYYSIMDYGVIFYE